MAQPCSISSYELCRLIKKRNTERKTNSSPLKSNFWGSPHIEQLAFCYVNWYLSIRFKIYSRFSCLAAQKPCRQLVVFTVFYEMGSALSEFERNVFSHTLLPYIKHPFVVERPCIIVRFSAYNHQFNIIETGLYVDLFQQWLGSNAFVFCRKGLE